MSSVPYRYNADIRITEIDIRRSNKDRSGATGDIYEHDVYAVPEEFQTRRDGTLYSLDKLANTINSSLYGMLPYDSYAGFDLIVENGEIVARFYVYNNPFLKRSDYNKAEYRAQLAESIYKTFHYFATCFV